MSTEKRRHARTVLEVPGSLSWHKEDGVRVFEKVKVIDASDSGARMECNAKLDVRKMVRVEIPSKKVDGMATVRSCRQKGLKYIVGLEYLGAQDIKPSRWS